MDDILQEKKQHLKEDHQKELEKMKKEHEKKIRDVTREHKEAVSPGSSFWILYTIGVHAHVIHLIWRKFEIVFWCLEWEGCTFQIHQYYTALLWQKEATLENQISRKWAKYVCHVHWRQCNIILSWLKYLSAGWVFLLQTQNGSRMCQVQWKTSLSQIQVICQLLPCVKLGQYIYNGFKNQFL